MKKRKAKGLKSFDEEEPDSEFPDHYDIRLKLKPTLQILHYNVRFEFNDNYPAKMPEDFARDMIKLYSKPEDRVWDGCCGSGIVPRMANFLGRDGIGSDVNPKAIEVSKKHDVDWPSEYFVADAREVELEPKADLILSSLPFGLNVQGDINHYSDEPKDISNCKDYEAFFRESGKIIQSYYDNLKPKGIMILDARDRTLGGTYYDVINFFRNASLKVGFVMQGRYYYQLIPYRLFGSKNRVTKAAIPLVDSVDAIVMYRPEMESLI